MGFETLSAMLAGIANEVAQNHWCVWPDTMTARAFSRRARYGVADGVLIPYINTAEEARHSRELRPLPDLRHPLRLLPLRSMNKKGLLGYASAASENTILALQVETAVCIKNIDEIAAIPGVDILFLGQNDLCMSMGLYRKVRDFPTCTPRLN